MDNNHVNPLFVMLIKNFPGFQENNSMELAFLPDRHTDFIFLVYDWKLPVVILLVATILAVWWIFWRRRVNKRR